MKPHSDACEIFYPSGECTCILSRTVNNEAYCRGVLECAEVLRKLSHAHPEDAEILDDARNKIKELIK